jgi:quinol monooxygenase YgiN
MATNDMCCSIVPYFRVKSGALDKFKKLCEQCVEKTGEEEGCLYYGFSFNGDVVHCREGYRNAKDVLAHLGNVDDVLQKMLKISELERLEVHGPEPELEKLRAPMAGLDPKFFVLELGFRR